MFKSETCLLFRTWDVVNLLIGSYSLAFRMDTTDIVYGAYTVDNIAITSCDYASSTASTYKSLLSFFCDFDNGTICQMDNGNRFSTPTYNFTLVTGKIVPSLKLGPTRDHISNSASGGFLHWDQSLPYMSTDVGIVNPSKFTERNLGMCLRFAYYVKSFAVGRNATTLSLSVAGCNATSLWTQSMDDGQGWQMATVLVLGFACSELFSLVVHQKESISVSIAFDDTTIEQCNSLDPKTTTSTTKQ